MLEELNEVTIEENVLINRTQNETSNSNQNKRNNESHPSIGK